MGGVDIDGSYRCRIWVGLVGTIPFGEALVRLCHTKRRTSRHRNRPVRDRPPSHYTGIILAVVTIAILKGNLCALIGAFFIVLGFWIKARLEERFLSQELGPEAYAAYRRRVPMLIPFFPP